MPEYICPHCKNPIYDEEALLCLYCGENLECSIGFMGKIKYSTPKIIIAAIAVLVLLSFMVLITRR